jgi:hypothetical protein
MEEMYTLTVSRTDTESNTSHEQTLTASNPADFKRIAQLAGILPGDESTSDVQTVPAPGCGCVDCADDCPCDCHNPEPINMPDTPYDGEDVYSPDYKMDNWQARSYEKFVKTPSAEWPQVFEQLTEDLVENYGLTKPEAEEKVLEVMSLDLAECYDYGHRDHRLDQHKARISGHNIDTAMSKHLDQEYVQARFTDNPLKPVQEECGKNYEKLYLDFVREQTLLTKDDK